MKYLIFLLAINLIFLSSCKEEKCSCHELKIPENLSPIDWDNYNDVYTVYWNYVNNILGNYSEDMGKDIKITGWIFQGNHGEKHYWGNFRLIENEEDIFEPNPYIRGRNAIYVKTFDYDIVDSLRIKFSEIDITKKCYLTGKLGYSSIKTMCCSYTHPKIEITNPDNIYFE